MTRAGTRPEKIRIQKWYTIYKDHITLADYEIHGEGRCRCLLMRGRPLAA